MRFSPSIFALLFLLVCSTVAQASHPLDKEYAKLVKTKLQRADDVTLLRRLSLQTRGVIPTVTELKKFKAAKGAKRIQSYASRFLKQADYAHYWSEFFGVLLREQSRTRGAPLGSYYKFISQSLHENKPYNKMVRELLTADGAVNHNAAANFYLRDDADPLQVAEFVGRAFYARRFNCARCHDHPYDKKFTRRDYYGLAAFFSQVWVKKRQKYEFVPRERQKHFPRQYQTEYQKKVREWRRENIRGLSPKQRKKFRQRSKLKHAVVVYDDKLALRFPYLDDAPGGDLVKPKFPYGDVAILDEGEDRRKVFAKWLTRKKNPRFRKVLINRVWTKLMGWSFFTPLDNWTDETKVVAPELLEHLDQVFYSQKQRIKNLILYIVTSDAWQRRAPASVEDSPDIDIRTFRPQRLDYAQLLNSLIRISDEKQIDHIWERSASLTDDIREMKLVGRGRLKKPKQQRRGFTNTCEVMKPARYSTFVSIFGSGERNDIDDDSNELSIEQVLAMFNGRVTSQVWRRAGQKNSAYFKLYERTNSMDAVVEAMYQRILSRDITPYEKKRFAKFTKSRFDRKRRRFRRNLIQDLSWSMMNSDEFIHIY